ncbi:hypothetical protein ACS0TY_031258 [Phlomoides rotata]
MEKDSEAQKWLDYYIYDYLVSRNLHATEEAFAKEINLQNMPPVRGDGYLFKCWSSYWSINEINPAGNQASTSKPHQSCAAECRNHFMSKL